MPLVKVSRMQKMILKKNLIIYIKHLTLLAKMKLLKD